MTAAGGILIDGEHNLFMEGRTLNNAGATVWLANGCLFASNGAVIGMSWGPRGRFDRTPILRTAPAQRTPAPPNSALGWRFTMPARSLRRARSRQLGNRPALGPFWKPRSTTAAVKVQSGTLAIVQGTSVVELLVADASLTVTATQLFLADYSLDADSAVRGQGHVTLAGLTTVNAAYSIGHGTTITGDGGADFSGDQPGLELGQTLDVKAGTTLDLGAASRV